MKKKRKNKKKSEESKDDKESKKKSALPEIVLGTTFAMHGHFKHDFRHLLSQVLFFNTYTKDRDYFKFLLSQGLTCNRGTKSGTKLPIYSFCYHQMT